MLLNWRAAAEERTNWEGYKRITNKLPSHLLYLSSIACSSAVKQAEKERRVSNVHTSTKWDYYLHCDQVRRVFQKNSTGVSYWHSRKEREAIPSHAELSQWFIPVSYLCYAYQSIPISVIDLYTCQFCNLCEFFILFIVLRQKNRGRRLSKEYFGSKKLIRDSSASAG